MTRLLYWVLACRKFFLFSLMPAVPHKYNLKRTPRRQNRKVQLVRIEGRRRNPISLPCALHALRYEPSVYIGRGGLNPHDKCSGVC